MFTDNYILNPNHKIKILLVGCGGTGSFILPELAGLSNTLKEMGHLGFDITVMDDDIIEEQNIGRQKFSYSDIGYSKAITLASRVNRFYATNDVTGIHKKFDVKDLSELRPNIIITAVDEVKIRKQLDDSLKKIFFNSDIREYNQTYYWIDTGNGKDYGQVVIATYKNKTNLPSIIDLHPNIKASKDTPSCSMRASLLKQSYMINKFVGSYTMELLSGMFLDYKIKYNALYFNLKTFKTKIKM